MPTQLSLFDSGPPAGAPALRPDSRRAGLWVAHGAQEAEEVLLERLDDDAAAAVRQPRLLARPLRVVVPSRSLAAHLAARAVARHGTGVAGVVFQTLHAVALEVLERAGEPPPGGSLLFEVLAERAAREQPSLVRGLEGLVDGYAGVFGTVRDLLDAGLEPAHAEAVDEALATLGPAAASPAAVERARALVRVAERIETAGDRLGIGRASHLYRRVAERVAADPEGMLPARGLYIYGFADATGVRMDLLDALLRRDAAYLILDLPADPAAERPGVWERVFTERLAERLAWGVRREEVRPRNRPNPSGTGAGETRPVLLEAAGSEVEVRGVALRLRGLLDAGEAAERIGVVGRDLTPYRHALRRHFDRLGIPFSALGFEGGIEPAGRRAGALVDLLRRGEATPCDRWLDALVSLPGAARLRATGRRRMDLRLALRSLGAGRLRDLAGLDKATLDRLLCDGRYALPVRQGLRARSAQPADEERDGAEGEDAGEGGLAERRAGSRATARTIDGGEILQAAHAARTLCRKLAEWPERTPLGHHLDRLRTLLREDLGWETAADPVTAAIDALESELPAAFPVTAGELLLLLQRSLAEAGRGPLGGRGGGVQVLTVTEARARTFDHLFVLGMNHDLFPRAIREDPLLPDALRKVLAGVLPDVPVKRLGFHEERYLFAQLLSASPNVTLSWQSADDDGRPRSCSPLVLRLLARAGGERLAPFYSPGTARTPRPADEQATLAALHGGRDHFGHILALALAENRLAPPVENHLAPPAAAAPETLAGVRRAILDEMDPDRRTAEGRLVRRRLGPWFGFVGALAAAAEDDPRRGDLWVTQLEGMAACPWQTFLTRLLRLEPTPDPLQALPGIDALLLGNAVHAALEEIVLLAAPDGWREGKAGEASLDAARPEITVPWPEAGELASLLRRAARRVVEEEGISLPGMAHALAVRALPLLQAAGELDWRTGPLTGVLGCEVLGELQATSPAGVSWRVRFKADRLDRLAEPPGRLRLTDYKTGRPLSTAKKAAKRAEHLLHAVRSGAKLQAVAYRLGGGAGAVGRYLYLRPDVLEHEVLAGDDAASPALEQAFAAATAAILGAWEAGAFFPRLVDVAGKSEPGRCGFCTVAQACLRGDSGARGRLFDWATAGKDDSGLLDVWRLPAGEAAGEEA